MYFPLGENFTNDTGGLSSSRREEDTKNPVITPNVVLITGVQYEIRLRTTNHRKRLRL